MIDGPDGPESRGRCVNCGRQRTFQNSPPRVRFDQSVAGANGYRSGVRWSVREEIRLSDE